VQLSAVAGSEVRVAGLGVAEIEGRWSFGFDDTPSGRISLHGADVLEADFDRMANGCVPLTVDGKAAGQNREQDR
jgi:hypothetical protein